MSEVIRGSATAGEAQKKICGSRRIEFANTLRGIAALSVIISHYFGEFWFSRVEAGKMANAIPPTPESFPTPQFIDYIVRFPIAWAPLGVALFFLISGFVIPFSVSSHSRLGFLIGRVLRIYPLYIVGFSITILSLFISGASKGYIFPYTYSQVLLHYIPGLHAIAGTVGIDGIIWTLEIEVAFYIVCAIFYKAIKSGSCKIFFAPAALLLFVYLFHSYSWGTPQKLLSHISEYMSFMFIGVAFNYAFRNAMSLVKLFFIVTVLSVMFFMGMQLNGEPPAALQGYFAALLIFSASAATHKYWKRTKVLGFLADISYPLYVVHGVMGYAILSHMTAAKFSPTASMLTAIIVSVTVAWALHVIVEMPSQVIGKKLVKRWE